MESGTQIIICILIAWTMNKANLIMTIGNYNALTNGYGSIETVIRKTTLAPVVYRVLMPWLVKLFEALFKTPPDKRVLIYETIKIAFTAYAFWAVWQGFGLTVMLAVAVLLPITFKFDYWDWSLELAAVGLGMTGNIYMALAGVILCGFARETAVIGALAYLLATGDIVGTAVLAVAAGACWLIVRLVQGKHKRYCEGNLLIPNWDMVKEFFKNIKKWTPVYYVDTLVSLILSLLALLTFNPVAVVLVIAGWVWGRSEEPRVFVSTLPFIAAMLLKGV